MVERRFLRTMRLCGVGRIGANRQEKAEGFAIDAKARQVFEALAGEKCQQRYEICRC
jgi:predicted DNA-binding WGR domain protein